MSWFRRRQGVCGWVALFALALQLTLTFGHVHAQAEPDSRSIVLTASGGYVPASHGDSKDRDDNYCVKCAILALFSGAQAAHVLLVAAPVVLGVAKFAVVVEALSSDSSCKAFHSRAPPLS